MRAKSRLTDIITSAVDFFLVLGLACKNKLTGDLDERDRPSQTRRATQSSRSSNK
jgi:hypothetical protein